MLKKFDDRWPHIEALIRASSAMQLAFNTLETENNCAIRVNMKPKLYQITRLFFSHKEAIPAFDVCNVVKNTHLPLFFLSKVCS